MSNDIQVGKFDKIEYIEEIGASWERESPKYFYLVPFPNVFKNFP